MTTRPYLLLGESDHRALAERVDAALAGWQREWLADGAPDPVFSLETAPRAERWLCAANDGATHLLLGCEGGWVARLGALAVGEPPLDAAARSPATGPLAASVGEGMLESLARRLLGAAPAAAAATLRWDGEGVPPAWREPGAGAAIYSLAPELPLLLALSPALVVAWLPKSTRRVRQPLAALPRAMEGCPVELQAVVGEAELELGELARLAAGDVIVLERRLDEPLALQLGDEPVAQVQLGTMGGGRAVQVVARSHN